MSEPVVGLWVKHCIGSDLLRYHTGAPELPFKFQILQVIAHSWIEFDPDLKMRVPEFLNLLVTWLFVIESNNSHC